MQLAKEGKILLDLDDTIETNHASAILESPNTPQQQSTTQRALLIQFGTLEPVILLTQPHVHQIEESQFKEWMEANDSLEDDNDGWELVTRRRSKGCSRPQPSPPRQKKRQNWMKNSQLSKRKGRKVK